MNRNAGRNMVALSTSVPTANKTNEVFASLTVDNNSPTPYTDATQVSELEQVRKKVNYRV